jgi:hypothetical protein
MLRYPVFTDLDGALLDSRTYSYEKSLAAIKRLKENGIPIIFCSAKPKGRGGEDPRPYVSVLVVLNGLPAQEGVGRIVNDIPNVACVAVVGIADTDYIPRCACEGVDVHHFRCCFAYSAI